MTDSDDDYVGDDEMDTDEIDDGTSGWFPALLGELALVCLAAIPFRFATDAAPMHPSALVLPALGATGLAIAATLSGSLTGLWTDAIEIFDGLPRPVHVIFRAVAMVVGVELVLAAVVLVLWDQVDGPVRSIVALAGLATLGGVLIALAVRSKGRTSTQV